MPHELADAVEGDLARVRALPGDALLRHSQVRRALGVGPGFWAELRALLDDADPRLAEPVVYWLWCGPFESAAAVDAAWHEMTLGAGDVRMRRLLEAPGPGGCSLGSGTPATSCTGSSTSGRPPSLRSTAAAGARRGT